MEVPKKKVEDGYWFSSSRGDCGFGKGSSLEEAWCNFCPFGSLDMPSWYSAVTAVWREFPSNELGYDASICLPALNRAALRFGRRWLWGKTEDALTVRLFLDGKLYSLVEGVCFTPPSEEGKDE